MPLTHVVRWLGATALASFLLCASAAAAQDDARTLFQRGQVAFSQGDYDAAIAQWTQAFALDPRPLLQWNLANAYERLGRVDDAVTALSSYLDHADPTDEHQGDARARVAALHARIESTGVVLSGGPEGAIVTLDGHDAGRLPRPDPIHVSVGSHRIVVHAPGYVDFTSTVVVPAGSQTAVPVEMAAIAVASAPASHDPPLVPIIVWSAAGVTLITAAILGGVALSTAGSAPASTGSDADTARGLALGSDVMFGVSAACAVAALVLTLVMPGSASDTQSAFHLTPNGVGGSF